MSALIPGSRSTQVPTPRRLLQVLTAEFGPLWDPCPLAETPLVDGLAASWSGHGTAFVNPPFNDIDAWLRKGYEQARDAAVRSVFLIPIRPHTVYWPRWVRHCADLRTIEKTMRFPGHKRTLREPMCIWVFDPANLDPRCNVGADAGASVSVGTGAPQRITHGWRYRKFDTPQDDDCTGDDDPRSVGARRTKKRKQRDDDGDADDAREESEPAPKRRKRGRPPKTRGDNGGDGGVDRAVIDRILNEMVCVNDEATSG